MRRALNPVSFFIPAALTALLFATAWMTTPVFFQHLIAGKQWGIERVVLLIAAFLVISLPFFRNLRISLVDAGIILLLSWWILGENFLQETWIPQETLAFHVALWGTVYLFVRSASHDGRMVWATVVVLLITALSLSILGLMQLYGFEASHHGLFKITGTFHNPGPFSGFVVSSLLALVGYTTCPDFSGLINRGDTEIHREFEITLCLSSIPPVQQKKRNMKQPGIPQEHHENHQKYYKKHFSVNFCVSSVRSA